MRFAVAFVFLSLAACPGAPSDRESDWRRAAGRTDKGSDHRRGPSQKSPKAAPAEKKEAAGFTFPIDGENVEMNFSAADNNTKIVIDTSPANQSLNILAGFDGRFNSKNPNEASLSGSERTLVFYFKEGVSLQATPGDFVKRGRILGSTKGTVSFKLKENNVYVRFCLNVINRSENLIRINVPKDSGPCEEER